MPIYPALALLVGSAIAENSAAAKWATRAVAWFALLAAIVCGWILVAVRNIRPVGDISAALNKNPAAYTLALGHMGDLTLRSFAYLRLPLLLAGLGFFVCAALSWKGAAERAPLALVVMMILLTQGARMALVVFDPYLSSKPLADAISGAPPGAVILDKEYYAFFVSAVLHRSAGLIAEWPRQSGGIRILGAGCP